MLDAGRIAPEFSLKDVDGERRSLRENLKLGPVLVVFFKINCPTCHLTLPFLERLKTSIRVVGISQDDASSTRGFANRFRLTFPTLLDLSEQQYPASNAYCITSVPSLFLIEPDGLVSRAFAGFSKRDFEEIGARAGVAPFGPDDHVPEWKAG